MTCQRSALARGQAAGGDRIRCRLVDHATGQVRERTGLALGKRQVEELAVRAAVDFDAFYAERVSERDGGGGRCAGALGRRQGDRDARRGAQRGDRQAAQRASPKLKTRLQGGEGQPQTDRRGRRCLRGQAGVAHARRGARPDQREGAAAEGQEQVADRLRGRGRRHRRGGHLRRSPAPRPTASTPGWRWWTATTTDRPDQGRVQEAQGEGTIVVDLVHDWNISGARPGASLTRATPPPSSGCTRRRSPCWKARPGSLPPRSAAKPRASDSPPRSARRLTAPPTTYQQGALPRLPHRARQRVADRHRRDRRRLQTLGERPDGHHRRPLGPAGSRSDLKLARSAATALRPILGVSPRPRTAPQPRPTLCQRCNTTRGMS